ncbi:hypothetical protein BT63DRAFT_17740 [Microthyrium microscopicum]|uniref:Uncharacterized protein n=1 Tax=Microthyrium microscopicum TaxID=703497 RepID=A0A6A6UQY4_9PEZI|nr:hypothetical protein BT63DRAFT_17740 [Microthyrium microscopicum]
MEPTRPRPWTPYEEAIALELRHNGIIHQDIARYLGRLTVVRPGSKTLPYTTVNTKINRLQGELGERGQQDTKPFPRLPVGWTFAHYRSSLTSTFANWLQANPTVPASSYNLRNVGNGLLPHFQTRHDKWPPGFVPPRNPGAPPVAGPAVTPGPVNTAPTSAVAAAAPARPAATASLPAPAPDIQNSATDARFVPINAPVTAQAPIAPLVMAPRAPVVHARPAANHTYEDELEDEDIHDNDETEAAEDQAHHHHGTPSSASSSESSENLRKARKRTHNVTMNRKRNSKEELHAKKRSRISTSVDASVEEEGRSVRTQRKPAPKSRKRQSPEVNDEGEDDSRAKRARVIKRKDSTRPPVASGSAPGPGPSASSRPASNSASRSSSSSLPGSAPGFASGSASGSNTASGSSFPSNPADIARVQHNMSVANLLQHSRQSGLVTAPSSGFASSPYPTSSVANRIRSDQAVPRSEGLQEGEQPPVPQRPQQSSAEHSAFVYQATHVERAPPDVGYYAKDKYWQDHHITDFQYKQLKSADRLLFSDNSNIRERVVGFKPLRRTKSDEKDTADQYYGTKPIKKVISAPVSHLWSNYPPKWQPKHKKFKSQLANSIEPQTCLDTTKWDGSESNGTREVRKALEQFDSWIDNPDSIPRGVDGTKPSVKKMKDIQSLLMGELDLSVGPINHETGNSSFEIPTQKYLNEIYQENYLWKQNAAISIAKQKKFSADKKKKAADEAKAAQDSKAAEKTDSSIEEGQLAVDQAEEDAEEEEAPPVRNSSKDMNRNRRTPEGED